MLRVFFIGVNVADAYITKLALSMGGVELMPVAKLFGSDMLLKGLSASLVVLALYLCHKEKLLLPLCLGLVCVYLWNLAVLTSICVIY